MDLVRSWLIAAVVLPGANWAIDFVVNRDDSAAYLLGPLLAGVASSLYHAERGVGAWGRHLLAVLPTPVVLQAGSTLIDHGNPAGGAEWTVLLTDLGITAATTALGLAAVMLTRLLLMTRESAAADSELS